jgi:hypothetical protein
MRRSNRPQSLSAAVAFAILALVLTAAPVVASCDTPDSDTRCWSDFDDFGAVTWIDDGYVAVGHLRGQPKTAWAMIHVSADGRAGSRVAIPVWRPGGKGADVVYVNFNKIVALPKGAVALIGSFQLANSSWQSGLVLAMDSAGRLKWSSEQIDPTASRLFQSGIYDSAANLVIAVGRQTSGPDSDGTCRNWSRSYIQGFNASDGKLVQPQYLVGEAAEGPNNRQAIYDIVSTDTPRRYAFVGFQSVPDPTPGHCQDRIQIGVVSLAAAGAAQPNATAFILPSRGLGSEDGYAIRSVGADQYVITGQIGDLVNGPSLAQALRVKLNPQTKAMSIERALHSPTSDLGSARGAARFRAIAPIRDSTHLVFLGSKSISAQGPGMIVLSQVSSADLSQTEPAVVAEDGGADIRSAAASPAGSVLAAGHAIDRRGQTIGWLELIGGAELARASPAMPKSQNAAVPDRAAPPLFQALDKVGSAYQLPGSALVRGSKYYLSSLPSGLSVDIDLSMASPLSLRARLLARVGDVDLALRDGDGHLIDFSNYRGGAPQLLYVNLRPGKFTLSLLAESEAKDIEFDIGATGDVDLATLSKITASLSADERDRLADRIVAAGASRPAEPSIAIGGETLLSLIAAKDAGAGIEPAIASKLPRELLFK